MTLQDYLLEAYPDVSLGRAEAAFADKVGTSRQNINRYRIYQRFPSPEMIARIRQESRGLVTADDHLPPQFQEKSEKTRARG